MQISEESYNLLIKSVKSDIVHTNLITGSASDRLYFRIQTENKKTYIITENKFIAENETFLYLTDIFAQSKLYVPKILNTNALKTIYIQEDLGEIDLMSVVLRNGFTDEVYDLYKKSILELAELQWITKNKIDYTKCYDFQLFDAKVVRNDFFYFKNYFLDVLNIHYNKSKLISEIDHICDRIEKLPLKYFLYRDFQSRNIIVKENQPYLIDYQGGMKGFLGYDAVSLLYQAKANLPGEWKKSLMALYFDFFMAKEEFNEEMKKDLLKFSFIMRFYQLLGAYGLRGFVERKQHFLDSILWHFENLKMLLEEHFLTDFPYLEEVTQYIVSEEVIDKVNSKISQNN